MEEEFHLLHPATGDLVPAARRSCAATIDAGPELQRTVVETATGVHAGLDDLRRDLLARRRELADAAAAIGLAVASVGTVPASGTRRDRVFPDPRYEWMAAEYRQLVDEQQVCACQVHVSVDDRDLAVRVTRRIRGWLPVLLAMSASSPCFQAEDTGYASYRTVVVSRWPTVGPPPDFASAEDYDRTVETLIHSGVISDAGHDLLRRPVLGALPDDRDPGRRRVPVGRRRRSDRGPRPGARGDRRARRCHPGRTPAQHDAAVPASPQVLLRAATWRAARSGLDGHLIDPSTIRAVPAADLVRAMLAHVRPVLEERGEWDVVTQLIEALLARGPSARRQHAVLDQGRSMADLVADLAAETAAG